jgi:cellulose synthase/poly-beta-1,6-N-acetylglucosamine synthase-like glycosyltransferase
MVNLFSLLLAGLAAVFAIPVAIFLTEVVAAFSLARRELVTRPSQAVRETRVAVLVPAHNESVGLLPTLADIKPQLRAGDRLLVVADNCTDDTAEVAASVGAEVLVRNEPEKRGKGYALAYGLTHLSRNPPEIVILVDADCRLAPDTVARLATASATKDRPVQALYLMHAPDGAPINIRAAEFAWRVKNLARPLGLHALGLPCQLMGTGMAFPWEAIRSVELASEQIVEDLKLGLDLAASGHPPFFYPSARVTSEFPSTAIGTETQRRRWEQGHIGLILAAAPRYFLLAVRQANWRLLVLTLDLLVPPLSLLGLLVAIMSVASTSAFLVGASSTAMCISLATLAAFVAGGIVCWLRYGRDLLPPGSLLQAGSYVIGKVPLYRQIFLRKSGSQWERTDRSKATLGKGAPHD